MVQLYSLQVLVVHLLVCWTRERNGCWLRQLVHYAGFQQKDFAPILRCCDWEGIIVPGGIPRELHCRLATVLEWLVKDLHIWPLLGRRDCGIIPTNFSITASPSASVVLLISHAVDCRAEAATPSAAWSTWSWSSSGSEHGFSTGRWPVEIRQEAGETDGGWMQNWDPHLVVRCGPVRYTPNPVRSLATWDFRQSRSCYEVFYMLGWFTIGWCFLAKSCHWAYKGCIPPGWF